MAFLILLIGIVATVFYRIRFPEQPEEACIGFGSNVINLLSITWILLVLWWNRDESEQGFGKAMKKEVPTLSIMIFLAGTHSILLLMKPL